VECCKFITIEKDVVGFLPPEFKKYMKKKHLIFLCAFVLSGAVSKAQSITEVKRAIKAVKIGPEDYLVPPAVDSVLLRKLAKLATEKAFNESVDAGYKKKEKADAALRARQNTLLLQSLLAETETSAEPNESIIATLAQVLESYKRSGDINSQALIMNTYAVYYARKGETEKAIPYFQDALRLKEQTKDKGQISKITVNLAAIFKALGRYDEAVAYNEYTIRANAGKDRTPIAEAYLDIATIKGLQQQYDQSEQMLLKKALPIFQSLGNKAGRMRSFERLADMYKLQNRYAEAKWFYLQAILMSTTIHDEKTHVSCLMSLAEVKNAINDHALALQDYQEAESIATANNYAEKLTDIKGEMGETYWKMGNYAAAGNALKEYNRLKDILLGTPELR
jgi:tetratricopeptide (TPR) repeat protein